MAKMIYCKTCGEQIAKSAKTCPHCGARNKKHGFLKFLLALVILGAVGGAFTRGNGFRKFSPGSRPAPAAAAKETAGETAAAAETAAGAETSAAATEAAGDSDGVTPELKEFLDSYEEFMNEYCDFLDHYDSDDLSQLMEYTSLMQKYAEYAEKADAYDEKDMSNADLKYYIDVTSRIEKRLIDSMED